MFTASKITADALHRLAALTNFCGGDPIVPILNAVNVSVSDGKVHGVATDRYAAALWTQDTADEHEPAETIAPVAIPAALLKDAHKGATSAKAATVTIAHDTETQKIQISWDGGAVSGTATPGDYPPVERLFSANSTSENPPIEPGTMINPAQFAKLAKLTRTAHKPADRLLSFALSANAETTADSNSTKRAPILAEADGYRAIFQPVTPTR